MHTTDDLATGNAPEAGGWRFDDATTVAFEDMLNRSIPQYDVMRSVVTDVACYFAEDVRERLAGSPPRFVDLGTSRGSAIAPIAERHGDRAEYFGYEISEPMLAVARDRFADLIDRGRMTVTRHDLRDGYPVHSPSSATLSVLTLQFVPIEYRQALIQGVYDHLVPGGVFVWVEKVLGATASLNRFEVAAYHGLKRANGYSQEAVDRKRLSLEGVLVPLTASFNEDLLRQAGFRQVDVVWRYLNFCAWAAVK